MAGRSIRKGSGSAEKAKRKSLLDMSRPVYSVLDCVPDPTVAGPFTDVKLVLDVSRPVYSVLDSVPDPTVAGPFTDVKLVSSTGDVLYGSRYNLAERSAVLNRMLLNGMKETTPASEMVEISFPEMSTKALRFLLEFSCTGSVSPLKLREMPVEVIHVSRYFQLWEHTDEMTSLTLTNMRHHLAGNDVSNMAAVTLCKALDCLSPDLDGKFFDYLLRVLLARPLNSISCSCISSRGLAFLLSRSLESGEQEGQIEPLPCATTEFGIFLYVLLWCGQQVGKEIGEAVGEYVDAMATYSAELRNHEDQIRLVRPLKTPTAVGEPKVELGLECREKLRVAVQPFLHLMDYKLMHPKELSLIVKPLELVPQDALLEAFCQQAAEVSYRGPVMYRGPFVLQWEPSARDSYMSPNSGDGKELKCHTTCGFARTVSPAVGSRKRRRKSVCSGNVSRVEPQPPRLGEVPRMRQLPRLGQVYKWDFVINQVMGKDVEFGIGLCTDQDRINIFPYSVWLGDQSNGWVLDGQGRFWHNKTCIAASDNIFCRASEFRVTVHLDMIQRSCSFSCGVRTCTAPWDNIPDEVYPAVTCKSSRVLDGVKIRVEPSQSLDSTFTPYL